MDCIKIKNFYSHKALKERKGQPQTWRRYIQYIYLKKNSYLEYIKNYYKLIRKTTQIFKRAKNLSI